MIGLDADVDWCVCVFSDQDIEEEQLDPEERKEAWEAYERATQPAPVLPPVQPLAAAAAWNQAMNPLGVQLPLNPVSLPPVRLDGVMTLPTALPWAMNTLATNVQLPSELASTLIRGHLNGQPTRRMTPQSFSRAPPAAAAAAAAPPILVPVNALTSPYSRNLQATNAATLHLASQLSSATPRVPYRAPPKAPPASASHRPAAPPTVTAPPARKPSQPAASSVASITAAAARTPPGVTRKEMPAHVMMGYRVECPKHGAGTVVNVFQEVPNDARMPMVIKCEPHPFLHMCFSRAFSVRTRGLHDLDVSLSVLSLRCRAQVLGALRPSGQANLRRGSGQHRSDCARHHIQTGWALGLRKREVRGVR